MSFSDSDAERIIQVLSLTLHPEGGWFRETWRSDVLVDGRAAGTSIHFLLEAGQSSAWHLVDADEFWLWHAGSPLELRVTGEDGEGAGRMMLGPDVLAGQAPQIMVPAGQWQATTAPTGWALVSCVVVPGFEFDGFRMASPEEVKRLDEICH